ncbi:hypothetical protein [Maribacter polysaccharolyticus]|uniref:hypothetical protein n=1 Tax=Maribacter polysaccharolyticus TaxID=3020831 RepID=UPI00237F2C66|nr:hypothetical protein [Maribacter polysaccharolyticus]MDE3741130.1 hypothetical protein [Maribacter polysaccharolyticus]
MKTKKIINTLIITVLTLFALLTLFLSSSVIFDWFGIRAKEGNYVLFIVWVNFICSIFYLITSFGLIRRKLWAILPINSSLMLLLAALSGLFLHIKTGGDYETKTIYAMMFRITLTLLFVFYVKYKTTQWKKHSF